MADLQSGIRNEEGFARRKGTVSDFTSAYACGVRGASDIDYCYEKNGKFLFMEGKTLIGGEDLARMNMGQSILLKELAKKPDFTVYLVVHRKKLEKDKNFTYYYIDAQDFYKKAKRSRSWRGQLELVLELKEFNGPSSLKQFWGQIHKKQQEFEKI